MLCINIYIGRGHTSNACMQAAHMPDQWPVLPKTIAIHYLYIHNYYNTFICIHKYVRVLRFNHESLFNHGDTTAQQQN